MRKLKHYFFMFLMCGFAVLNLFLLTSSAVIMADNTQNIVINVDQSKFNTPVESGINFDIPTPKIYVNALLISDAEWYWSYIDPNTNIETKMTRYNRTLKTSKLSLGTYTIKYCYVDDEDNVLGANSQLLNIVATEKPQIVLGSSINTSDRAWNNGNPDKIELPMATAKDKYFSDPIIVGKPKVTNSKGDEIFLDLNEAGNAYIFTPLVQGTYTIVYTAHGKYLSNTKTFSINVADIDKPLSNGSILMKDVEAGNAWTFRFDMIEVNDDNDDLGALIDEILNEGGPTLTEEKVKKLEEKRYIVITMTKNGAIVPHTIANNGLRYVFSEVGTYYFTITLTDTAGNSTGNTYRYAILVKERTTSNKPETKQQKTFEFSDYGLSIECKNGVLSDWDIDVNEIKNVKYNSQKLKLATSKSAKIYKVFDFKMKKGDAYIVYNDPTTIKLKLDKSLKNKDVRVVYISDDGEQIEEIKCSVIEGVLTFNTEHFSQYAIVIVNKTNVGSIVALSVGGAVVLAACIAICIVKKKKKEINDN